MAIAFYGGDARVIATRDELFRIAANLNAAANRLRSAPTAMPSLFLDLLPNPLPNLQLALQLPAVTRELERLAQSCLIAAESYFSAEAQVTNLLLDLFRPVSDAAGLLALANPISAAMSDVVSRAGAALAVAGLVAGPSFGSTQVIGQGARLISNSLGQPTPAALLAGNVPPLGGGSATLVSTSQVKSGNLGSLVSRLHAGYWNPTSAIRIQSYSQGLGKTFVVLIPGTQSFVPFGRNPLDIGSNLAAMAGSPAPSQQAVSDALRQVGASKRDRVIFIGHSQGGLIAANLATAQQAYRVAGLVTLGSPVAHLDLKIPTISVQHRSDPIPQLSGTANPMRENWVTVSSDQDFSNLVQAHHIAGYAQTVQRAEGAGNPGLDAVLEKMQLPAGEGVEYLFRLSRD